MKILTGALRGKSISFKPNPHLRPTSDKVRKALFDMLQGAFEEKTVLDLFSGSGALGLEALSCGAGFVTFVEINKPQARRIKECLANLSLQDKSAVLCADTAETIKAFSKKSAYFDFVFLDPPYEKNLGLKTLETLGVSSVIHENTLVILECNKREALPVTFGRLHLVKSKAYGDTKILIYQITN